MSEKIPNQNQEKEEKSRVWTEEEYIARSVQYALSVGWVKEAQKDILVEEYLKPIHKKYLEIIEELKSENEVSEDDLKNIVLYLNYCLESTRRIGSTDKDNIIKTLEDYKNRSPYPYANHAVESLLEFVREVLSYY